MLKMIEKQSNPEMDLQIGWVPKYPTGQVFGENVPVNLSKSLTPWDELSLKNKKIAEEELYCCPRLNTQYCEAFGGTEFYFFGPFGQPGKY